MPALGHTHPTPYADVQVVGIPRALLYHRYGTLWTALFERLGRTTVLSRPTDREVVARGEALAVDECCLASKVYLGHVADLLGRCDAVFVPSMANLGVVKQFCTKFHALPDIVANTFGDQVHVVSCRVGVFEEKRPFEQAFADLAQSFGATPRQAKRAVREAFKAQERHDHELAQAAEARLCARRDDPQDVRSTPGRPPLHLPRPGHGCPGGRAARAPGSRGGPGRRVRPRTGLCGKLGLLPDDALGREPRARGHHSAPPGACGRHRAP